MYRERMMGYYPQAIQSITDFKAIVDSEAPEFEILADNRDLVLADAYLVTMAEDRIKQWEQALSIRPLEGSTIDDRRDTIIARIRGNGKLNTATIQAIVNAFTGGSAITYVENSTLYVIITPPPDNKEYKFANVEAEIANRVPAHLGLEISRNYISWDEINDQYSTWGDIKTNFDTWNDVYLFVPFNS